MPLFHGADTSSLTDSQALGRMPAYVGWIGQGKWTWDFS